MEQGYMDEKGLVKWTNIPVHTIRSWRQKKFIPYHKVGRLVRFNIQEIESWLGAKKISVRME